MNVAYDRRQILNLLRPHFPVIPDDITSDELHGWLNAQTGLDLPINGPEGKNANVFDQWRKVLAAQGLPFWNYTQAQLDKIKTDGLTLKAHVDTFNAAEKARLAALAKEAPLVTAEQLLSK